MGENTITKPLGLVLIITAHIVFNDPSHAEVIGTLGSNITLQFIFNISFTKTNYIAIYTLGEKKIDDYAKWKRSFDIYPQNSSVFYHITNLTINHSNTYWASVFLGFGSPEKSNEVQLIVEERNTSSTAPPTLTTHTGAHVNESSPITNIVIVLAVLPVVLLATVLPWLICSLVKPTEMGSGDDVKPSLALNKQQQQQQQQQRPGQSSTLTVHESIESSSSMPTASVIYSVLDFPRRPPTAVEINPRDTEYAAVSYLQEKRYM
ncbi:uncharacterized protein LOC115778847 [Archocentrus centrarchus]|uniref:uncharacterized protein LOC115778847 n=1 Tax=Archocentrus centrarchus TaxID=63155 RepID=UPI0011EA3C17|nr:uncharacterized protein LOC115778847 [Archocentrus centrarchus]